MTLRVVEHAERSDTGRVRDANEDSFLVRSPLFVVADGMGGASAGEVASRAAVEEFTRGLPSGDNSEEQLATVVAQANRRINTEAASDEGRRGMGTTVTAALVGDGTISIAHVGDSRAYLIRGDALAQLTRDHTLVDELVRQGQLTPEEAAEHPQRSIITRALGPEPHVEIDTLTQPVEEGDVLLLCSDGLTGMVDDATLASTVAQADSLDTAARELISKANAAGGRDNITVLLVRIGSATGGFASSLPGANKTQVGGAAADASGGKSRRGLAAAVVVTALLALILGAGWEASRAVFFLGTDSSGTVTIYRGLPYELPLGLDLYQRWYTSGVPATVLTPSQKVRLLDHKLRTKREAADLVASLERGDLVK
ncbi:MAG: Stp1/IreP family PP2C-type Ser/Thr phosphatase [Actinomycetes bacterium]